MRKTIPQRILQLYAWGSMTLHESVNQLVDHVTTEDLAELPKEWLAAVKDRVNELPDSREEFDSLCTYQSICNGPNWKPPDDPNKIKDDRWAQIQIIKKFFDEQSSD